jgi:hypothetical protein
MSVRTFISVPRGDRDVFCRVVADVTVENRFFYIKHFESELPLSEAEREEAEDKLIDQARCYG